MKLTTSKKNLALDTQRALFLNQVDGDSPFAESYRYLRTNISFAFLNRNFQTLMLTSAGPGEGKTTTVGNLCYSFAQAGKTVLMVDADMRKQQLTRIHASDQPVGLSGILSRVFSTRIEQGHLAQFGLGDLMQLARLNRLTGELELADKGERIALFFSQGELVDLNWRTRPREKSLVAQLIRAGLLTKDQARNAYIQNQQIGQNLGFLLTRTGWVEEEALRSHVNQQMVEGLQTLAQMSPQAQFRFKVTSKSLPDSTPHNLVDLKQLYQNTVVGGDTTPYLLKEIRRAIEQTETENLYMLASGPYPPKPAELLDSDRMRFLLKILTNLFDLVIIDSPPVLPTSDPLVLAPYVDGTLLVIKSGQLDRDAVRKAVEQLQMAKANLIGTILNQADHRHGRYPYYGYGYGGYGRASAAKST